MKLKLFAIKFNPEIGRFEDEALETFQEENMVLSYHPYLIKGDETTYLGVFIAYSEKASAKKTRDFETKNKQNERNPKEKLTPSELKLFEQMKKVRKDKSDAMGLPPYILSTNAEMKQIIKKKCTTIQSLKAIRGFGKKKLEAIGHDFITLIKDSDLENGTDHAG